MMEKEKLEVEIGQFFRPDGTLTHIPARLEKKLAVLHRIAKDLSSDLKYPEKELNQIIAKYHPDTAAIRRHMVEFKILDRNQQSVYWLIGS